VTRLWLLLALLLVLSSSAPSRAAEGDVEKARDNFNQAIKEQNAGNWERALQLLRAVEAVKTTPQVRFNIALCEEHLGQTLKALEDYEHAAKEARAEDNDKVAYEAESRRAVLEQRVPHVLIRRGEGATQASIELDGKALEADLIGKRIPLDPGSHLVEATTAGRTSFKKIFKLNEGQTEEVTVTFGAPPPVEKPKPQPKPEPEKRSILPFVVGGVGAASLVASGVFFLLRRGTISTLDDECGSNRDACPESERDTYDRGKTYNLLTNVTLAVGVVGVGAGVALYVLGSPKERTGAAIVPGAPASIGGASLVGHF